jgi:hypothetical protein
MSLRACRVGDGVLFDFADGLSIDVRRVTVPEPDIDAHVAGCDDCQAFLAELWHGELETDLVEPVLAVIELERFLIDVTKLGSGILAELLEAIKRYGLGASDDD